MSLSNGISALIRAGYILAMYTGVRAAFNRVCSIFLPQSRAAVLDRHRLRLNGLIPLAIRVHARVPAKSLPPGRPGGMFSIRLVDPRISRPLYWLFRMTSHFGCGHIEIAFYENQDSIVVFAVRNILKANVERLGFRDLISQLQLVNDDDEIIILREVSQALEHNGLKTSFAAPDECVKHSVNKLLLHPKTRAKTLATLQRKYARIGKMARMYENDQPKSLKRATRITRNTCESETAVIGAMSDGS